MLVDWASTVPLAAAPPRCDIPAMILSLAAASLAAAQPSPEARERLPRELVFARTRVEGWRVEGRTDVEGDAGLPTIRETRCEIARTGLKLVTWPQGGLGIHLGDTSENPALDFGRESSEERR